MILDEIKGQISTKQRTLRDLLRFIRTRTDSNSNYNLLLGAGCSVTSGVRSAAELCNIWRYEIVEDLNPQLIKEGVAVQQEWLKRSHGDWYDPQREYSTLFEKKYDLQRQRRMFVENEVKVASPSIGYAYLTSLVDQEYFNTIFTTNFDDLINEAFFLYSNQRPIVCAHDSSINSITVTSKRPKIIKLHGDYLFDDIKATDRETESLGQNMKEKFIEFAKDFGLIVVGYAGGDRSIIDVLSLLLKNDDYFRNGVYWCVRKGSDIPEELRRLFWKDRVYFVEIEGFDELFAEMYSSFNNGNCIPPAASLGTDRYEGVVKRLLGEHRGFPETTPILRSAKSKLKRLSTRKAIANFLVGPDDGDKPGSKSAFTDEEILEFTKLQHLFIAKRYEELIGNVKSGGEQLLHGKLGAKIGKLMIDSFLAMRKKSEAIGVLDQMTRLEPFSVKWILMKADLLQSQAQKFNSIELAKSVNDESYEVYRELGRWYSSSCDRERGELRQQAFESAKEAYLKSLELNPSSDNRSWSELHSLISKCEISPTRKAADLDELEKELAMQGAHRWRLLNMKAKRFNADSKSDDIAKFKALLLESKRRVPVDEQVVFDGLLLSALMAARDKQGAQSQYTEIFGSESHKLFSSVVIALSVYLRKFVAKDRDAASLLGEFIGNEEFSTEVFSNLFYSLLALKEWQDAEKLIDQYKSEIHENYEMQLRSELAEWRGDFSTALELYDALISRDEDEYRTSRSYLLLCLGRYEEAKQHAHEELRKVNFSVENVALVVNYELARKKTGQKPDNNRLDALLKFDGSDSTKAVVAALRGHSKDAIEYIKSELRFDAAFRFDVSRWPVFDELRSSSDLMAILSKYD